MSENQERSREADKRYVKFKMKRVKRERNRGNHKMAERHANELVQYLGITENTERPIDEILSSIEAESGMSGSNKLKRLRNE